MKNKEMVNEWFRLSKHDSDTVNYLYKNMPSVPIEIVCYHCQQSAEKLLKGLLTAKEISKEEMTLAVSDMNKIGSFVRKEILKIQNLEKTNQKNITKSPSPDFSPTR